MSHHPKKRKWKVASVSSTHKPQSDHRLYSELQRWTFAASGLDYGLHTVFRTFTCSRDSRQPQNPTLVSANFNLISGNNECV
ncbi:hypothetical protein WJX73_005642 [Symbiochloris irregularis]|uniref:Uncharacterized protein n=1 Tax=Symbiochloris irregularis TaxID=706552 RepID=A0AAW1NMR5_9CHLO